MFPHLLFFFHTPHLSRAGRTSMDTFIYSMCSHLYDPLPYLRTLVLIVVVLVSQIISIR